MKITIKKAKIEDLEALLEIKLEAKREERKTNKNLDPIGKVKNVYKEYLKKDLESKYREVFMALDGKKIVGLVVGRIYRSLKVTGYERRVSLGNLFVKPEYRKKGIAKKMMSSFIEWCNSENIKTITLSVYPQNTHVHELYSKVGFEDFCITMHKKL